MGSIGEGSAEVRSERRVLVVEDDPLQRRAVVRFLSRWGYEALEAGDGGAAIDRVAELDGQLSLIVLDVMLPVCDGIEVASRVGPRYPKIPILACSAAFSDQVEDDLRSFGVRDFLPKPYPADRLKEAVSRLTSSAAH